MPCTPKPSRLANSIAIAWLSLLSNFAYAQDQPVTDEDATVTYPASFFAQYSPFSVNDMLDRIPGINVARGGSGGGSGGGGGGGNNGGPGSSGGADRRGLGLGGDQILINGRRITGKENEGNSQLSRIPASQVQYIEIIRGTSGALDVRGGNQVINIVMVETETRSTISYELNTDRYEDGTIKPGAKVSLSAQRGAFEYLISAEIEPRREFREGFERSILADGRPNDTVNRDDLRDSSPVTFTTNLGYRFSDVDIMHFNLQYSDAASPGNTKRKITNLKVSPATSSDEYDDNANTSDIWELGSDYEHTFANGSRWKTLLIANRKEDDSARETFVRSTADWKKDLYLANFNRYQERILRTSYSFSLSATQDLEIGIERAQTILDSSLQLGLLTSSGAKSAAFGGLTPITDSNATVEEIRYEGFLVHNWQLNSRMSLESTLIVETSEIEQSGDISKQRDFDFIRPKVDYRFDLTPALQFRASIEKDVAQLSFNDFTANVNGGDDDQDAVAGNPDLRQEQSWRYDLNLEYRFSEDNGVLNTNVFYHELEDVIDKVDVSTSTKILSANGNIGDGERYGIDINASLRLGLLNQPGMLVTSGLRLEDSEVTDPFLGIKRRLRQGGRGNALIGFRHDLAQNSLNYGFNYRHGFTGNQKAYDIDKIEDYASGDFMTVFLETRGWADLTYRFEAMNLLSGERCRIRSRFIGGTIATGRLNEIEDSCSDTGIKWALKVRGTF